jgi:hypothetical protein
MPCPYSYGPRFLAPHNIIRICLQNNINPFSNYLSWFIITNRPGEYDNLANGPKIKAAMAGVKAGIAAEKMGTETEKTGKACLAQVNPPRYDNPLLK